MKTGFSKLCINPPLGSPIVGYYHSRYTKGVLDDLYVRATAFDDGETQSVLLVFDLCLLPQEFFDRFKKCISEATNIDEDAIFIACQHTHTGPLVGVDFASETRSMPEYDDYLTICARDAAVYALNDLKESKFYSAESRAQNISFCRRYRMKDGSVQTNPGVGNKNIDHCLSDANDRVKLLKIVREGGNDIFIVNFGTHADTVGGDYISADFPGFVCSTLEAAIPDMNCMFLLAPQGDVNHINPAPTPGESAITTIDFDSVPRGIKHAQHMGRVVAGAVLSICSTADEIPAGKIAFGSKIVKIPSNQENDKLEEAKRICKLHEEGRDDELPYKEMALTTELARARRIVKLKNGPDSFEFKLSAISMGGWVFAGIAGEPFTEIATRIYEASPFDVTLLSCLANAAAAYIPTTKAYSEGGYEAATSTLRAGGDDIVVNGMIELLKELK